MPKSVKPVSSVRLAQLPDVAEVRRIQAACFGEAWSQEYWRQHVSQLSDGGASSSSSLFYVSAENRPGALHGFLLARRVVDEAEILAIAVAPLCRRQGVAKCLVDRLITDLRRDLPCRLFLEVSVENRAALELYRQCGLTEVGTRKGYYRAADSRSVDARILALKLAN